MVWSAADSNDPAGLTQSSVYLASDRPVAEVKAVVQRWLDGQQPSSCWRGAAVTVRQVSSSVLHFLFYMPETAHRKLVDIFAEMTTERQCARCLNFEEDSSELMALRAMKAMLQRAGLAPGKWTLHTAFMGKDIDVVLYTGSTEPGGAAGSAGAGSNLAIQRIEPADVPVITEVYRWSAGSAAKTPHCHGHWMRTHHVLHWHV